MIYPGGCAVWGGSDCPDDPECDDQYLSFCGRAFVLYGAVRSGTDVCRHRLLLLCFLVYGKTDKQTALMFRSSLSVAGGGLQTTAAVIYIADHSVWSQGDHGEEEGEYCGHDRAVNPLHCDWQCTCSL